MFDLHYDLLTYIYMNRNDLRKVKKHCKKIFKNNICGGIFNLFYMSLKEMEEELGIKKEEINITKNLETVNRIIEQNNLIPNGIEYIIGIEGLDYLENIGDLERIYKFGLRSVNIVWNNDNKFGGGARGDKKRGLTKLGEKLVKKLVDMKIAIDLSHTNYKTFYDIVDLCTKLKKEGRDPIIFASHSNARVICNHKRNLKDDQILKIKELGGVIGIAGVKSFCINEETFDNNKEKYENAYVEHIKHIRDLLGGTENISISSDDMSYYKTKYYKYFNVFKQEKFKQDLERLLYTNGFINDDIENIMYNNFKNKILQRL